MMTPVTAVFSMNHLHAAKAAKAGKCAVSAHADAVVIATWRIAAWKQIKEAVSGLI